MSKYRIISIDGGGIRGLIAAIILERLVAEPGLETLIDSADLVAGTSTGALLALGMANNVELAEMREVYVRRGPKIFDDSWIDNVTDLGKLLGAEYDTGPLRRELRKVFGKVTLGELTKEVLVTSFDLDNQDPVRRRWKPKLFHNFIGSGSDQDALAVDVGLYSSAAPTYFPSVGGYIDGGVYANNPSMCALAQALDKRYQPTPALEDIQILSLGTGKSLQYVKGNVHDWGYTQWLRPLVTLILEGTSDITDYQCRQLLGSRFHRLAPEFPPGVNVPLDAVKKIPYMIEFARELPLEPTIAWLRETWFA